MKSPDIQNQEKELGAKPKGEKSKKTEAHTPGLFSSAVRYPMR
jgi:hypothetical protein